MLRQWFSKCLPPPPISRSTWTSGRSLWNCVKSWPAFFYVTVPAGNNVTELRMCCRVAPWISLGWRLVYKRVREKCEIERKTWNWEKNFEIERKMWNWEKCEIERKSEIDTKMWNWEKKCEIERKMRNWEKNPKLREKAKLRGKCEIERKTWN